MNVHCRQEVLNGHLQCPDRSPVISSVSLFVEPQRNTVSVHESCRTLSTALRRPTGIRRGISEQLRIFGRFCFARVAVEDELGELASESKIMQVLHGCGG